MKNYKRAPEDSSRWKCNWIKCAGGMGLAGTGMCSFRGEWDNPNCPYFMTEESFLKKFYDAGQDSGVETEKRR